MLRYLARSWFQRAAREKVLEALTTAARNSPSEKDDDSVGDSCDAEEHYTADVGVVFALAMESGGFEDLLDGVITVRGHGFTAKQGGYKGRRIVLVRSEAGTNAARRATQAIFAGHKPRWMISAGFAGGLVSGVNRFDVIMADSLIDAAGNRLTVGLRVDPESLAKTPGVHVGAILTVDKVVRFPSEKRSLGQKYPALAVDMESFAVAQVCREEQVRFLAVRVVTDPLDEQLPPDIERLLRQNSRLSRLGAAIGAVWNRPSSARDMWQLRENAILASDRLAKFLAATIEQLAENGSEATKDS